MKNNKSFDILVGKDIRNILNDLHLNKYYRLINSSFF